MNELEEINNLVSRYLSELPEYYTINSARIRCEDLVDKLETKVNSLIGVHYSENDIIISALLNNRLLEARSMYKKIMDIINLDYL